MKMSHNYAWIKLTGLAGLAWIAAAGCGGSDNTAATPQPQQGEDASAETGQGGQAGGGGTTQDGAVEAAPDVQVAYVVDLRADNNRNGTIDLTDPTEDENEDTWDKTHGAIFLANIDDDEVVCDKNASDIDLPKCNDAADDKINGTDDLTDLARLKTVPWPDAVADAKGTVSLSAPGASYVRLFRKNGDGTFSFFTPDTGSFSADELKAGVELGIEAKDIVRDSTVWDGYVDVTFKVTGTGVNTQDTVKMRVSPVMTFHHLLPVETSYASTGYLIYFDDAATAFHNDFAAAVTAAGVKNGLVEFSVEDQWTQDFLEPAYMSMPAEGGEQKVIRVFYRSANTAWEPTATNPLRESGKVAFTVLRGKDVAAVQEYDPSANPNMDSLNSYGNLETIPPFSLNGEDYPLGRVVRGSLPSYHPDAKVTTMLASQLMQPEVDIDTSWLLVGHIDETISFIKVDSPRGWAILANDAAMAKKMLEDQVTAGNGDVVMFSGMKWYDDNYKEYSAEKTISEVLADTDVMSESAKAVTEVQAQLATLKAATGITDAEIISVPFLHWPAYGYSIAYQPGTVNSAYLSPSHFAAPDPHGPVINGKDIFKDQLETALGAHGITVDWIEDWDNYHRLEGEVHCGSNSARSIPDVKWWVTGR